MSLLNDLIRPLVDLGSESYEDRIKELILFAGLVVLALIVVWKRG